MFTKKTKRHPIEPNSVPEKCWEETSVDTQQPSCTCGPRFGLSLPSGKNS